MKKVTSFISITLVLIAVYSCSTKKDRFVNRTINRVGLKYNILFNGEQAHIEEVNKLKENSYTDFSEIIHIEELVPPKKEIGNSELSTDLSLISIGGEEENALPEKNRTIEKAEKAIKNHSMVIARVDRNKKTDEAYMLMGQNYYYNSEPLSALNAFGMLKLRYKGSDSYYPSLLWSARTYLLMGMPLAAMDELNILIEENDFVPKKLKKEIGPLYAQAHIDSKNYDKAIKALEEAEQMADKKENKLRYAYLRAQVHQLNKDYVESSRIFDQVIQEAGKKEIGLFSHIGIASNFNEEKNDAQLFFNVLDDLKTRKEYQKYLPEIYAEKAAIFSKLKQYDSVENSFLKAKNTFDSNKRREYVLGKIHQKKGDYYYNKGAYLEALDQYDSATLYFKTTPYYLGKIQDRMYQLRLVKENIIAKEKIDSTLKVSYMNPAQRLVYFTKYIEKREKEQAIKDSLALIKSTEQVKEKKKGLLSFVGGDGSSFYFYDSKRVANGKKWYDDTFGSNKLIFATDTTPKDMDTVTDSTTVAPPIDRLNLDDLLGAVIEDENLLDSLAYERDYAAMELAKNYRKTFKNNQKSKETLLTLLQSKRIADYTRFDALYKLYKIAQKEENQEDLDRIKNQIIEKYPTSKLALHFQSKEEELLKSYNPQALKEYQELYTLFESEKYNDLINLSQDFRKKYETNKIIIKFDLLEALTYLKKGEKESAISMLDNLYSQYPESNEGTYANKLLKKLNK